MQKYKWILRLGSVAAQFAYMCIGDDLALPSSAQALVFLQRGMTPCFHFPYKNTSGSSVVAVGKHNLHRGWSGAALIGAGTCIFAGMTPPSSPMQKYKWMLRRGSGDSTICIGDDPALPSSARALVFLQGR